MWVKKLFLRNFRNYTQAEVHFSPGVNWITGKNGQGKTNLLEAIYLLSMGRSFRTPQLGQLIQQGAPFFYIEAEIEREGVTQTIKISFDGENKKVQHNASMYTHFAPLIGLVPHVLYAPEDIALVSGLPLYRRKFLDLHLAQFDPLYLRHLARYSKALRQRNELLKSKSEVAIEPWEVMMAQSADYLIEKRALMIEQLQQPLNECIRALSNGSDSIGIHYKSSTPEWQKNRKRELFVGTTLSGPHRDDIQFQIKGLAAKSFASEGQKHSIIAALRLCQWDHLEAQVGCSPLMSIDDFGAHLDQERQAKFQEKLSGQIFLTSPNRSPEIFPDKQVIQVELGQVAHVGSA
ncbi:MAG: DNA replication/repair protein RecF [Verrucomicrobia bacterium]|nr:DNA replication/repair protein RecF [Verrucomicrobiota bacterium]